MHLTTIARTLFGLCHRLYAGREDRGASLVEYALLVTLIAIVCLAAVLFFGQEASTSFSTTANSITNA